MWECGLKPIDGCIAHRPPGVTPYVGVWIETEETKKAGETAASLLMWECGLKQSRYVYSTKNILSLLMWECGLKLRACLTNFVHKPSLLMWECGLKHGLASPAPLPS